MSKTARALELAEDIASMRQFFNENLNSKHSSVWNFCAWAITQHEDHACHTIGIDTAGLDDLMAMFYEYDAQLNKADPEHVRSYQEIAIALFRYYLQPYKANKFLHTEELEQLAEINTLKVTA